MRLKNSLPVSRDLWEFEPRMEKTEAPLLPQHRGAVTCQTGHTGASVSQESRPCTFKDWRDLNNTSGLTMTFVNNLSVSSLLWVTLEKFTGINGIEYAGNPFMK